MQDISSCCCVLGSDALGYFVTKKKILLCQFSLFTFLMIHLFFSGEKMIQVECNCTELCRCKCDLKKECTWAECSLLMMHDACQNMNQPWQLLYICFAVHGSYYVLTKRCNLYILLYKFIYLWYIYLVTCMCNIYIQSEKEKI